MADGEHAIHFSDRENVREQNFQRVWNEELDDVFADVANITTGRIISRASVFGVGSATTFSRPSRFEAGSGCWTSVPAPTPSASRCCADNRI